MMEEDFVIVGSNENWRKFEKSYLQRGQHCKKCLLKGIIKPATRIIRIDNRRVNDSAALPLCDDCYNTPRVKQIILEILGQVFKWAALIALGIFIIKMIKVL
jgi:hypothetical protein